MLKNFLEKFEDEKNCLILVENNKNFCKIADHLIICMF